MKSVIIRYLFFGELDQSLNRIQSAQIYWQSAFGDREGARDGSVSADHLHDSMSPTGYSRVNKFNVLFAYDNTPLD